MTKKPIVVKCTNCKTVILCPKCNSIKKQIKTVSGNYAKTKKGVRKDIHPTYSFKSATEANFARLLNYLTKDWKYEERAFTFTGYCTKPHVYIMDFEILSSPKDDLLPVGFYEIKGFMNAASRQKLRRYVKHYPAEAKNTIVVLYNSSRKNDIEFCTKLNLRLLFYNELLKEFKDKVDFE